MKKCFISDESLLLNSSYSVSVDWSNLNKRSRIRAINKLGSLDLYIKVALCADLNLLVGVGTSGIDPATVTLRGVKVSRLVEGEDIAWDCGVCIGGWLSAGWDCKASTVARVETVITHRTEPVSVGRHTVYVSFDAFAVQHDVLETLWCCRAQLDALLVLVQPVALFAWFALTLRRSVLWATCIITIDTETVNVLVLSGQTNNILNVSETCTILDFITWRALVASSSGWLSFDTRSWLLETYSILNEESVCALDTHSAFVHRTETGFLDTGFGWVENESWQTGNTFVFSVEFSHF